MASFHAYLPEILKFRKMKHVSKNFEKVEKLISNVLKTGARFDKINVAHKIWFNWTLELDIQDILSSISLSKSSERLRDFRAAIVNVHKKIYQRGRICIR